MENELVLLSAVFDGPIWSSQILFLIIVVGIFGAIGLASKSMALGVYGAFLMFIHLATATGQELFTTVMYVAMGLMIVALVLKTWGFAFGGGDPTG